MIDQFPLLSPGQWQKHVTPVVFDMLPKSVPWSLVERHDDQARKNHGGQSLAELASRGGLSPAELYCVMNDKGFYTDRQPTVTEQAAAEWLLMITSIHQKLEGG